MKASFVVILATLLQSSFAMASTPAEAVPGMDRAREGDLATKAGEYFDANGNSPACDVNTVTRTNAYKISSGSAHDEKTPDTTTSYDASYLVVKQCLYGSTYAGAYRDASDAAVVKAHRVGRENAQGVIIPSQPDQISIVKKIDPKSISTDLYGN